LANSATSSASASGATAPTWSGPPGGSSPSTPSVFSLISNGAPATRQSKAFALARIPHGSSANPPGVGGHAGTSIDPTADSRPRGVGTPRAPPAGRGSSPVRSIGELPADFGGLVPGAPGGRGWPPAHRDAATIAAPPSAACSHREDLIDSKHNRGRARHPPQ